MSQPIVRWRVSKYSKRPERLEFVRETKAYYINAKGERQAKHSSYHRYCTTEQEALLFIDQCNRKEAERIALRRIEGCGPELLAALEASPHQLHADDESGPCLCSQCAFVRLRDAVIAKAKGEPA